MRLFRFGPVGQEKPGVFTSDGRHLDVSGFGEDFDESFFETRGIDRLRSWLGSNECPMAEPNRFAPCIARPSKIICIGLNYRAHAAETGFALPEEPKIFMKATTAWSGAFDDVVIPRGSFKTDYEVELAVVIGQRAKYVERAKALEYVAGYACMNDYSERDFQKNRAGQWVKGKSADSFAPCGPYFVSADEVEPGNCRLFLEVNGDRRQDSTAADMVFDVPTLVSYLSEFMTLLPGDVISTGTPPGVGLGRKPPEFLKPGDQVRFGIECGAVSFGIAEQRVVASD